jgi:hypothetical protein
MYPVLSRDTSAQMQQKNIFAGDFRAIGASG